MTKFEENAIQKQEDAYTEYFANRAYDYSCKMCSERGLDTHHHGCDNCPVKEAHMKALEEIASGKRKPPEKIHYGTKKFVYNNRITIVMNFYNTKD